MRQSVKLSLSVSFRPSFRNAFFSLRVFYFLVENMFRLVPLMPASRQVNLTGRRISCKKRECRRLLSFAVSLIRMLDGAVRRTTGGGSAAPLNGRAASVQLPLNLHLCLCRSEAAASWRESCIKKGAAPAATASSDFRDKTNVRLKRVLDFLFFLILEITILKLY